MKKIVIIEDNPDIRDNTAELLELSGYKVITAENGRIGVTKVREELPDLILCDIMMPELDGFGVLHLLAKDEQTSGIPFVFLTAKTEKADWRKGMMLGADDYLTKPFDEHELLTIIEIRLGKSKRLREESQAEGMGFGSFLETAQLFSGQEINPSLGSTKSFSKKVTLFKEGQLPAAVYYINKGVIKTYKTNEFGKELITNVNGVGDFVGVVALLEDEPYQESAEVLEDVELVIIPANQFQQLLFNNREVSRQFIRILSGNVLDREQKLIRLAYNSVRKRVAEALLTLHEKYNLSDEIKKSFSISRDDLASMIGTATESAIRTLSDFKEEGIVSIEKNKVSILSVEKLKRMKN